jgi:uncharacterized protein YbjQ (UPF0145 family)
MYDLLVTAGLLTLGFVVGRRREKKHFVQLQQREAALLMKLPTRAHVGQKMQSGQTFLVMGSVVVATDYFKNFVGALKSFFGGRMQAQEALLDRARREAMCRMRENALARGAVEVVDVHIETAFLDKKGVEVCAYATAFQQ